MSLFEKISNNQVIYISGTPCTGKTTIASQFNDCLSNNQFNSCFIKINDFAIENGLVLGEDPDKFYKVIDIEGLNQALNERIDLFFRKNNISSNNSNETESKNIVIVEGHLSHLCDGADKMIVLRLNPSLLKERLEERNYSQSKIQENLEAEALAVCSAEAYELYNQNAYEIDTSGKSTEDVLDIILKIISDELESPLGTVDFMDWFLE